MQGSFKCGQDGRAARNGESSKALAGIKTGSDAAKLWESAKKDYRGAIKTEETC
jgi:hypothetical protein